MCNKKREKPPVWYTIKRDFESLQPFETWLPEHRSASHTFWLGKVTALLTSWMLIGSGTFCPIGVRPMRKPILLSSIGTDLMVDMRRSQTSRVQFSFPYNYELSIEEAYCLSKYSRKQRLPSTNSTSDHSKRFRWCALAAPLSASCVDSNGEISGALSVKQTIHTTS